MGHVTILKKKNQKTLSNFRFGKALNNNDDAQPNLRQKNNLKFQALSWNSIH